MSKSSRVLALKIAQIVEEYSEGDIEQALKLLDNYPTGNRLIQFFSGLRHGGAEEASGGGTPQKRSAKSVEETTSRAVLAAKDKEPDKFELLSEFDQLVRSGRILQSNESLRRFGEQLSKNFEPKKSRRESISAVMAVLSEHSIEEIRDQISAVIETSERQSGDSYQKLANFLIKGR